MSILSLDSSQMNLASSSLHTIASIRALFLFLLSDLPPNGLRYPLVGGTRQRHFDGTRLKPRKLLENAQTPTTLAPAYVAGVRVHAVLGRGLGSACQKVCCHSITGSNM